MARTYEYDEEVTEKVVEWDRLVVAQETLWKPHGPSMKARWSLDGGYPEFDFVIDMQIPIGAPASYSISLRIADDQPAVRLCVRGIHRNPKERQPVRGKTHLHDVRSAGRDGVAVPAPNPPFDVADDEDVTDEEYRRSLLAFCEYLAIDVAESFVWQHPNGESGAANPPGGG